METCKDRIRRLIQQRSVRIVPEDQQLTLSSGRKSRVFCDLKKMALAGDAAEDLATVIASESRRHFGEVDAFAGVALGGCQLASIAGFLTGRHVLHVRKEAKDHGTKGLVEAPDFDKADTRVVLLEDVTTSASSALKALESLRSLGYNVVGVLTVVDRRKTFEASPGGPDELGGLPFRSLYRLEEMLMEPDRELV